MSDDYIRWIIYDQAIGLLNMTESKVAEMLGISRQSLAKYRKNNDYGQIRIKDLRKLENHLAFVKAALLVTEATPKDTL